MSRNALTVTFVSEGKNPSPVKVSTELVLEALRLACARIVFVLPLVKVFVNALCVSEDASTKSLDEIDPCTIAACNVPPPDPESILKVTVYVAESGLSAAKLTAVGATGLSDLVILKVAPGQF